MRIDAHQPAVLVGVAVASAGEAGADVAHDRTGVAADLVVRGHTLFAPLSRCGRGGRARCAHAGPASPGAFAMRTPVA